MGSPTVYVVRNEVDADCEYHCGALASRFPGADEVDFVRGERCELSEADGIVLTGSTAGVYESEARSWIAEQEALVSELVTREIPTLGVCFGHQIVNSALGGTVERVGVTAELVEADLADDPLFEGVDPVVPAVHGDVVTEAGRGMDVIASAPHAHVFGTRHRTAPIWTVQFHPEITAALRERLVEDFGWESTSFSFADVSADAVFENFEALVEELSTNTR